MIAIFKSQRQIEKYEIQLRSIEPRLAAPQKCIKLNLKKKVRSKLKKIVVTGSAPNSVLSYFYREAFTLAVANIRFSKAAIQLQALNKSKQLLSNKRKKQRETIRVNLKRETDRQTDRRTDIQTNRQTEETDTNE